MTNSEFCVRISYFITNTNLSICSSCNHQGIQIPLTPNNIICSFTFRYSVLTDSLMQVWQAGCFRSPLRSAGRVRDHRGRNLKQVHLCFTFRTKSGGLLKQTVLGKQPIFGLPGHPLCLQHMEEVLQWGRNSQPVLQRTLVQQTPSSAFTTRGYGPHHSCKCPH